LVDFVSDAAGRKGGGKITSLRQTFHAVVVKHRGPDNPAVDWFYVGRGGIQGPLTTSLRHSVLAGREQRQLHESAEQPAAGLPLEDQRNYDDRDSAVGRADTPVAASSSAIASRADVEDSMLKN